jgi:hypothetical protein
MTNLTQKKMKSRYLIVLFVLFVVTTNVIHAQNLFRIEFMGGSSLNLKNNARLFSNWGNGYLIGGGVVYQLFPSFDLAIDIAYQGYQYKGGNLELIAPDVLGWEQSVSGSASNVLECSVVFRNTPRKSLFYPIFSLRLGVFRSHIGEVLINEWYDQTPGNVTHQKYKGTGIIQTNGFAALGLGFNIPLKEKSRLILESRIEQTFDLKQTFIPILLTFQHDLGKKGNR